MPIRSGSSDTEAASKNFNLPKTKAARDHLANVIGADGRRLLYAIHASDAPAPILHLAGVDLLKRVWDEQFVDGDDGQPRFRTIDEMLPPADLVTSPYDPEARYNTKRGSSWVGYKVHLRKAATPKRHA